MRQSRAKNKRPGTKNRLSPTVTVIRCTPNASGDEPPEEPAEAGPVEEAAPVTAAPLPVAPRALPPRAPGPPEDAPGVAEALVPAVEPGEPFALPAPGPGPEPEPEPEPPDPVMSLEMSARAAL